MRKCRFKQNILSMPYCHTIHAFSFKKPEFQTEPRKEIEITIYKLTMMFLKLSQILTWLLMKSRSRYVTLRHGNGAEMRNHVTSRHGAGIGAPRHVIITHRKCGVTLFPARGYDASSHFSKRMCPSLMFL